MSTGLTRRHFLKVSGGVLAGACAAGYLGYKHEGGTPAALAASEDGNWQSRIVYYGPDGKGRLNYASDSEGNRIPDFSYAGYKNNEVPLPRVPTVKTIGPIPGDNTAHIQAAIDEVGGRPMDAQGFRGALVLEAGEYVVSGTVYLRYDGVVLRGVGDDADTATNTVIRAVGDTPHQRDVLIVGGGDRSAWEGQVPGSKRDITTDFVQVGSHEFKVEDSSPYKVGDNIIVYHPCSEAWLKAVDYGGTDSDPGWTVGSQPIIFNRYVTAIQGKKLTIDAPVYNHLDRSLSQSYVYVWNRQNLVTQVGVENLRIDIVPTSDDPEDENHAANAITLQKVEDSWVQHCTTLHFTHSGVRTYQATRATIEDCSALDPVAQITGGRRYNFCTYHYSQMILFRNCYASLARHAYVSNGTSTVSDAVFLRCTAQGSYTSSEGHRRWSQAMLYDNHQDVTPNEDGRVLGLYNRGDYGTGHGWAVAHSVIWNANVGDSTIVVQKPPTAQNYSIGCFGREVSGDGPFDEPAGYIEGTNRSGLYPDSLYEAQLAERLQGIARS